MSELTKEVRGRIAEFDLPNVSDKSLQLLADLCGEIESLEKQKNRLIDITSKNCYDYDNLKQENKELKEKIKELRKDV